MEAPQQGGAHSDKEASVYSDTVKAHSVTTREGRVYSEEAGGVQ